jgi:hypothetical protein
MNPTRPIALQRIGLADGNAARAVPARIAGA